MWTVDLVEKPAGISILWLHLEVLLAFGIFIFDDSAKIRIQVEVDPLAQAVAPVLRQIAVVEALDAASNREDLERLLDEAFDAGLGPDCDEFLQVFVDMVFVDMVM